MQYFMSKCMTSYQRFRALLYGCTSLEIGSQVEYRLHWGKNPSDQLSH